MSKANHRFLVSHSAPIIFNNTNYHHKFQHVFATDSYLYTFYKDDNDRSLTKLARLCAETHTWEKVPIKGFYPSYRYQVVFWNCRANQIQSVNTGHCQNFDWQHMQTDVQREWQQHLGSKEKQSNQTVFIFLSDELMEINLNTLETHSQPILPSVAPLHRPEDMEPGDEHDEAAYLENAISLTNISWHCSTSDPSTHRIFLLGNVNNNLHNIFDQRELYCLTWNTENGNESVKSCKIYSQENIKKSDNNANIDNSHTSNIDKIDNTATNVCDNFESVSAKHIENFSNTSSDNTTQLIAKKGVSFKWQRLHLIAQEPLKADHLANSLKKISFMAYWNDHLYLFLKYSENESEIPRGKRLFTCQYLVSV